VSNLVVLPTYNEAENVIGVAEDVLAIDDSLEILVVDDASPDGTGELVAAASRRQPRLHLLRRPGKLGLGTAYLAGFRHGLDHGYERILTMDCDRSHNPRYIPALLAATADADLAIGSRYAPGGGILNWPWHRRALSAFANLYARTLLRLPVGDCTSGFRCYRREVLASVEPFGIRSSGYSFLEEMAWRVHRCGFRIAEVPIVFEQRTAGVSKIDSSEIWRAAWHVLATALRPMPLPPVASALSRSDAVNPRP
jgi:dolichol-phosphate mannosyltransferase